MGVRLSGELIDDPRRGFLLRRNNNPCDQKYPQPNYFIDAPAMSLRFELLREGIEDYEYLWLLKSLGDETLANQAVESLVVDVSAFSRNVEELFAWRQKTAERIESLQKAKKR